MSVTKLDKSVGCPFKKITNEPMICACQPSNMTTIWDWELMQPAYSTYMVVDCP